MNLVRFVSVIVAACSLASQAHAQSGACCDTSTTGACTLSTSGASGCACGTTYMGDNTTCTNNICRTGACCVLTTGACSINPASGCPDGSAFQGANSACTPNPCGGACCNTSTGACTVALNAAACAAGTTFQGAGAVCSPSPCGQGACCNSTTGACTQTLASACASPNQFFGAGSLCSPTPCATGACCSNTTGACTTGGTACASGLTFQGPNTTCSPTPCPTQSACCNNTSAACSLTLAAGCASGSTFQGTGTVCSPNPCGLGACCNNTSGACTTSASAGCASGSTFQGVGTVCSPSPCGQGACCNPNTGACSLTTSAGCTSGNSFQPGVTSCGGGFFALPNPCAPTGACCSGTTCTVTTMAGCTATYNGNGSLCYAANPCGTGACCAGNGTCSVTDALTCGNGGGTFLGSAVACPAGHCWGETEPNDNAFTANGPFAVSPGDEIVGYTLGNSLVVGSGVNSVDFFLVTTPPHAPGIYLNTLVCTASGEAAGATGHLPVGDGISQIDSVPNFDSGSASLSTNAQIASTTATGATPARSLVWYDFGASPTYRFRVQNNSGTTITSPYVMTYSYAPVTPTDLGTMPGGLVTITTVNQGHTSNTDMAVYDANFNPIPGYSNDDLPNSLNHGTLQSQITKDMLTPGAYYLALSDSVLSIEVASPPPPFERDPNNVVALPGTVVCTSASVGMNLAFTIIDGAGVSHPVAAAGATKANGFNVLWYKFTLTAPGTGACCKPDGSCSIASQTGCTSSVLSTSQIPGGAPGGIVIAGLSGVYQGNSTTCAPATCPAPAVGACCDLNANCTIASQANCTAYTGSWHGAGTTCLAVACPGVISGGAISYDAYRSGAQQGGVFVDITTGSSPISITRIDYYCVQAYNNAPFTATGAKQSPMEFVLWARSGGGSYSGYEGGVGNPCAPPSGSNWVDVYDSGATLSTPGYWQSLPVTLPNPIAIPPATTQGLYITSNLGGEGYRTDGVLDFSGTGGVTMHSDEGRTFAFGSNPGWSSGLIAPASFNGRIFYQQSGACCASGSLCTITTPAACTAMFKGLGTVCSSPNACCRADFNNSGTVTVQDIFDFLAAWFQHLPSADFNLSGAVTVQDIFDFLAAWFAGCH